MIEPLRQCATCPWRVNADPDREVRNGYSRELHAALENTIAEPGVPPSQTGPELRAMACHYSDVGRERACAGWAHHQLGPGNNLALRIYWRRLRLPPPEVHGEQHETFEATMPWRRNAHGDA